MLSTKSALSLLRSAPTTACGILVTREIIPVQIPLTTQLPLSGGFARKPSPIELETPETGGLQKSSCFVNSRPSVQI
jgi:hypothetical protein